MIGSALDSLIDTPYSYQNNVTPQWMQDILNADDQYGPGSETSVTYQPNTTSGFTPTGPQPGDFDDVWNWANPMLGEFSDEYASIFGITDNTSFGDLNWGGSIEEMQQIPNLYSLGGQPQYGGYSFAPPTQSRPSDSGMPEWIISEDDYGIGGGPEGWTPFTVKDPADLDRPDVVFTMLANALSQGLSGADAWRTMADLGAFWSPQGEGGYNDPWDLYQNKGHSTQGISDRPLHEQSLDQFALGQTAPGGQVNSQWYGGQQFDIMDKALENMASVIYGGSKHGVEGLGTPYSKLRELINVQKSADLGTRAGRSLAQASLDPILAGFTGDLGGYAPLAQQIANPFFANVPGGLFANPQRNKYIF